MLLDMRRASRCHAVSKRSGLQCRAPAVRGHSVCRMHGAAGGAPKGNRNALKHGEFTAESFDFKREIPASPGWSARQWPRSNNATGNGSRPLSDISLEANICLTMINGRCA